MILKKLVDINQGIPLSRIRLEEGIEMDRRYVYSFEEESEILLPRKLNKRDQKIPMVEEDMILLNLTSYNVKIAEEDDIGKVVPSNYIMIKVKDSSKLDPDYLEWYLDKSESFERELYKIKQGSAVRSIPINEFRNLDVDIPDIDFQKKFGRLNKLIREREELFMKRQLLLKKALVTVNEEAIEDEGE